MCSIFGAIGSDINHHILDAIQNNASDRGRDGGRRELRMLRVSNQRRDLLYAAIGAWRAIPTQEVIDAPLQPYDGIVHNGTIANDVELGRRHNEVDSQVLPRILDRSSLSKFAHSLRQVTGSYAIGAVTPSSLYLATNYKPIHYAKIDGTFYFSSMARHFVNVMSHGQAPVMMTPYTVLDLLTGESLPLKSQFKPACVVIASGGLDSTVAATVLKREGWDICLLHFQYGCAASLQEQERIPRLAKSLDCPHVTVTLDLKTMLGSHASRLFNASEISDGLLGTESPLEWVPARNLVFTSLAMAWAEANGYHAVALGNNLEEAGTFPDNEEQFTHLLDMAAPYAVAPHYGMRVLSPVGHLMKHEIVRLGHDLQAPLEQTWSCYRDSPVACGSCASCRLRAVSFNRNGLIDPVRQTV